MTAAVLPLRRRSYSKEFGLTSTELGFLLSAFFWVYTPAQFLGGWLVHRFDVRWVLGIGVLVWGCATALIGLAGGTMDLEMSRLRMSASVRHAAGLLRVSVHGARLVF